MQSKLTNMMDLLAPVPVQPPTPPMGSVSGNVALRLIFCAPESISRGFERAGPVAVTAGAASRS